MILQRIVDGNTDVFRYGLWQAPGEIKSSGDVSVFEDPTILGFTLEIDEINSPLFNGEAEYFLKKYSHIDSIKSRMALLKEFKEHILKFFKSQESIGPSQSSNVNKNIYIKSHYINSISNLNVLSNRFIDYLKDKITVELYEDISLHTTYLSTLYNNLLYSYNSGRFILPENLTKFHLNIKISEIRNFNSMTRYLKQSKNIEDAEKRIQFSLKNNISCIVYTLWDCNFDFQKTLPFEDTINQAGIDANIPKYSTNTFDIFFKSTSRYIRPSLLSGFNINDGIDNLGVGFTETGDGIRSGLSASVDSINVNGNKFTPTDITSEFSLNNNLGFDNEINKKSGYIIKDNSINTDIPNKDSDTSVIDNYLSQVNALKKGELVGKNNTFYDENDESNYLPLEGENIVHTLNPDGTPGIRNKTSRANGLPDSNLGEKNLIDRFTDQAKNTVEFQLQRGLNKLRQARAELLTKLVNEVRTKIGVQDKKITPDNVYKDYNLGDLIGNRIAGDLGFFATSEFLRAFNRF